MCCSFGDESLKKKNMSFRRLFRRMSRRESRKSRRRDSISLPKDFEHRVHVIMDKESGKYIGLPSQWVSIMNTKAAHSTKRSNSSPDLRARQHFTSKTQNGSAGRPHETSSTLPRQRNSLQDDQESTIERLKLELREYRATFSSDVPANRYSWQDGPSTLPRANGKINNNEKRNENLGHASTLSPVSFSAISRSESTV